MKVYNSNRKLKKKYDLFYLFLISLLILFIVIFYLFKTNYTGVISYMAYPYKVINNLVYSFKDNNKIMLEKERLEKENLSLKMTLSKYNDLDNEINVLKKMMELKNIYTNYKVVNATIINKNKDYFFNNFTIDKGHKDHINKNNPVMSSEGLIGYISEVYFDTAVVKLITNNEKISVKVVYGDKAYYTMMIKSNNDFVLEDNFKLKETSKVYTSGYGNFVNDLYIGEAINNKVVINDFNNLKYVAVLVNNDN